MPGGATRLRVIVVLYSGRRWGTWQSYLLCVGSCRCTQHVLCQNAGATLYLELARGLWRGGQGVRRRSGAARQTAGRGRWRARAAATDAGHGRGGGGRGGHRAAKLRDFDVAQEARSDRAGRIADAVLARIDASRPRRRRAPTTGSPKLTEGTYPHRAEQWPGSLDPRQYLRLPFTGQCEGWALRSPFPVVPSI